MGCLWKSVCMLYLYIIIGRVNVKAAYTFTDTRSFLLFKVSHI
jgi:hypothetical protein